MTLNTPNPKASAPTATTTGHAAFSAALADASTQNSVGRTHAATAHANGKKAEEKKPDAATTPEPAALAQTETPRSVPVTMHSGIEPHSGAKNEAAEGAGSSNGQGTSFDENGAVGKAAAAPGSAQQVASANQPKGGAAKVGGPEPGISATSIAGTEADGGFSNTTGVLGTEGGSDVATGAAASAGNPGSDASVTDAASIPPDVQADPTAQMVLLGLTPLSAVPAADPADAPGMAGVAPVSEGKAEGLKAVIGNGSKTAGPNAAARKPADADAAAGALTATVAKPAEAIAVETGARGSSDGGDSAFQQMVQTGAAATPHLGSQAGSAPATPGQAAPDSPQATANPPAGWDPAAPQVVNSAQLIQSMHQSEMRMGMNSAEFGNLSITTSLSREMLSAQISTDHAGLGRELASQMPAFQERLASVYGVQARVEVRDDSATAGSGHDGSDRNSQGSTGDSLGRGLGSSSGSKLNFGPAGAAIAASSATMPIFASSANARLDIRI